MMFCPLAYSQNSRIAPICSFFPSSNDIFEQKKADSQPIQWWDKAHTYVNAIANELYLSVASHLANRETSPSQKSNYLSLAQQQWKWFQDSGMINSGNTINDGLTTDCKNNGGTVWSYNQGVILGALAELNKADSDGEYLNKAKDIATAAISSLGSSGVLKDPCEPNCGADGNQFKGVFMRGLQRLQEASPEAQFAKFTQANADSIWANDRNDQNELGVVWAGPFVDPATASTQSSALDALVAAVTFNGDGK
jgi:predicted alpha-1,6-mannanase (GH76 family)